MFSSGSLVEVDHLPRFGERVVSHTSLAHQESLHANSEQCNDLCMK